MENSTKTSFKLNELRQLLKQENTLENWCESSRGLTEDESVAEHEAEFRQFMEEVELAKRLSLIEFLGELNNPNYEHDWVYEPPSALAYDIYRLYCEWCKLDDKPKLNEKTFLHGLYLFGFVSENWHIGIEGIKGIGIEESDTEIRLNLVPNNHSAL
jgi:hypothetical protein